jgi:hypothetical protein
MLQPRPLATVANSRQQSEKSMGYSPLTCSKWYTIYMKHLTTLLFALAAGSAFSQPLVGLHIGSHHSAPGFNDSNPGVYVRWVDEHGDGWGAGVLRNSEHGTSLWAGYTLNTPRLGPVSAALTVGAVTGYRAAPVLPLLTPSVALHSGANAVRLTYLPRVTRSGAHAIHLSVERKF